MVFLPGFHAPAAIKQERGMPAMKKLKLSIAAKISRAWPAPTVGSDAGAWEVFIASYLRSFLTKIKSVEIRIISVIRVL